MTGRHLTAPLLQSLCRGGGGVATAKITSWSPNHKETYILGDDPVGRAPSEMGSAPPGGSARTSTHAALSWLPRLREEQQGKEKGANIS